jgi:hypothetical protein
VLLHVEVPLVNSLRLSAESHSLVTRQAISDPSPADATQRTHHAAARRGTLFIKLEDENDRGYFK